MKVIVAQHGGFCSGVKNAVDTAMRIEPENTYIYGEIIHNKDVVDEIEGAASERWKRLPKCLTARG